MTFFNASGKRVGEESRREAESAWKPDRSMTRTRRGQSSNKVKA